MSDFTDEIMSLMKDRNALSQHLGRATVYAVKSKSATERFHYVMRFGDTELWVCDCDGSWFTGDCWHVDEAKRTVV